jgi:uncharacterized protein involved in outer membrane biogenesis
MNNGHLSNTLLYLGSILAVVLAALFAVPNFIDWNGYRGVFEEEASKVLGRDVRVGGAVNLRLLPTPYVRFEKVRLADLTGQTGEPFVRVESFTMRLAVTPLLRGVLEANEIELTRPVLTLAFDGQGGGNWSNVQVKPGALPFVPQNVALHSVKLIDGVVAIYNPGAQPVARIDAVNGELSADALNGPFKFKGRATWGGEPHDIKFATTAPEADGTIRIKATSRTENSTNTFALDGKVASATDKPRLDGELTAKLAIPKADIKRDENSDVEALVMDFKSRVTADAAGAQFDEIAMALDNAAEPQLIAGTARAVWAGEQRFDLALTSKWLDLDRLAGAGTASATFTQIKNLVLGVIQSVAGDGAAGAKIDVEQIKIGGETAGGLKFDAERRGRAVLVKDLRAGLPGGARLDLVGEVKDDGGNLSFTGNGFAHGSNLARLIAWAEKSGAAIDIMADGPFSVGGMLAIGANNFELTNASAEISGRPFSGGFKMSDGGRRVAATLEGESLDSAEVFPATAAAIEAEVRRAFGLGQVADSSAANTDTKPAAQIASAANDITLRLLAGKLKHGSETFRAVDATFGFEGGEVRIPSAGFTTSGGLAVVIEGHIKDTSGDPSGRLAYEWTAENSDAMRDVVRVFGLEGILSPERMAASRTGRAAGLIRLGERGKGMADVSLDGTIASARTVAYAEFDGGLRAWRTAPSRLRASAKSPDLGSILASLGETARSEANVVSRPTEVVMASAGVLANGAAVLVDIASDGLQVAFDGTVRLPDAAGVIAKGKIALKSSDIRDVLALAGANAAGGLEGIGANGQFDLANDDGGWTLSTKRLALGGSTISGTATFKLGADGTSNITAVLDADVVPLPGLLAAIIERPAAMANVEPAATGPDASSAAVPQVWPDAAFNFDGLGKLSGGLRLGFARFDVSDDLAVRTGAIVLSLAPGKIAVTQITGEAAGGKVDAAFDLEKAPGGVSLAARIRLDGIELGSISALGKGRAALDVTASSRAQSPSVLMAVLAGSGALTLEDAHIPGPGPRTAADVADAVMQGELPNEPEAIASAIQTSLKESAAQAGTRDVAVKIADGIAKLETASLATGDGTLAVSATANLTTLVLESTWLVAPVVTPLPPLEGAAAAGYVAPPAKGPLPPAAIVYSGTLGAFDALTARVDVSELQRELTVRQMERNVEELERLRLQDEDRARLEVERRKALDAERAAARLKKLAPAAPPVLPESNQTPPTDSATGQAVPPQANGAAPPPLAGTAPPVAGAANGPATESAPSEPAAAPPPRTVAQPRAAPRPRRTTQDQFTRPLGGFP